MWACKSVAYRLMSVCGATCLGVGVADEFFPDTVLSEFSLVRCGRAATRTAAVIMLYKTKSTDEISATHKRSAEILLDLCRRNRGVYVKLGQHIAAMDYLLPKEYISTFKILQHKAPQSSYREVIRVVKEELGLDDIHDVFQTFQSQPCGAASLAQTHLATLRSTREEVAVKVQHRDVRDLSEADLRVLEYLVYIAKKTFPDVKFDWLTELMRENLPREMDFIHEGQNCDKIRKNLKK